MDVREYDLNLIPGSVPQIIKINQYDKGISFTFTIYQGDKKFSIPSGAIVALSGTKPDGLGFHYACTFSGSTASVTIGDQVAVLSGNVRAELTITSGDSVRLGTANFTFCVEPAALKDDTAVSDSDFPEIIKAANNIGAAQKSADAAAKSAQDAKNSASSAASAASKAISGEVTRAKAAEKANADAISAETTRAKAAEKANADAISAEVTRAKAAEKANADTISKLNSPENPSLLGSEDDLNNVLTGGFYHIDNGYNPANMPEGNDNAALLVMQGRSHTDIVQILISGNSDNILYRTGNTLNKYWADWRKIANIVDVNTINAAIQGVKDSRTSYVNCGVLVAADMDAFALNCGSLIKSANPFDTCGFTSGMFQAVHEGDDYYYDLWYVLGTTEVDLVFFKQRADTMIKYKITGDSIVSKYVYQNVSTLADRIDTLSTAVASRAALIPTGTQIYSGDDLNNINYTEVGTYYCSAIVEAQQISNLPEVTAFMLSVYNPLGPYTAKLTTPWQYRLQEFLPYHGAHKYIRMVSTDGESNVTWGDWMTEY